MIEVDSLSYFRKSARLGSGSRITTWFADVGRFVCPLNANGFLCHKQRIALRHWLAVTRRLRLWRRRSLLCVVIFIAVILCCS